MIRFTFHQISSVRNDLYQGKDQLILRYRVMYELHVEMCMDLRIMLVARHYHLTWISHLKQGNTRSLELNLCIMNKRQDLYVITSYVKKDMSHA